MTRIGLVVFAVLLGSGAAFGADLAGIPTGSRVRVSSPTLASGAVIGTLAGVEAHAVVLTPRPGDEPLRVALDAGTKLELSVARRSQWARGAMMGAAIGAVPGLLLTFGDYSSDVHGDNPSPAAVAAMGAVGGALVGAAVGWAIKRDDWQEVSLPNAGIGLIPWCGGVAASVHVSWGAHRGR
jgi:membrane associated rhomboid family serine protease